MFIDEWYEDDFYQSLPDTYRSIYVFGQFFYTHVYYAHENLEFWRPILGPGEPTKTVATEFRIESFKGDAFSRDIPLNAPKLKSNEEFIVVRAKKRPAILILPEFPKIDAEVETKRRGIQGKRCLITPIYSLADTRTKEEKYPKTFIDRMRQMEWPQLLFLPKKKGFFEVDSMIRLDEIQSVYIPHLEPKPFALSDDVSRIFKEQVVFLTSGKTGEEYAQLREMLIRG